MKTYFLQDEDGLGQVILDAENGVFEFYASIFAMPDCSQVCKTVSQYLEKYISSTHQELVFTFRVPWVTASILQKISTFCVDLFQKYTSSTIRWYYNTERHSAFELEEKLASIFEMPLDLKPYPKNYLHPIYQAGNDELPEIILDAEREIFEFSGQILPEDANIFYESLEAWINRYVQTPNNQTHFHFKLAYFNSGVTDRVLLDIFMRLKKLPDGKVIWYYDAEDEEMREAGQELAELAEVPCEYRIYE